MSIKFVGGGAGNSPEQKRKNRTGAADGNSKYENISAT